MALDPRRVAIRLGFEPVTIARLRSGGHLSKLALTQAEIRRRLYRAHRRYLLTKGERIMDVTMPSERRAGRSAFAIALAALAIGAGATAGAYQAFGWGHVEPSTPGNLSTPGAVESNDVWSDSCYRTGPMHPC